MCTVMQGGDTLRYRASSWGRLASGRVSFRNWMSLAFSSTDHESCWGEELLVQTKATEEQGAYGEESLKGRVTGGVWNVGQCTVRCKLLTLS